MWWSKLLLFFGMYVSVNWALQKSWWRNALFLGRASGQCAWDKLGPGTWDLGPFAAPGQTSPQGTDTKKPQGTKNNCAHAQLEQIMDKKIPKVQKKTKTRPSLMKSRDKNRVSWAKAGSCACPLHSPPPKGWADHLSCPLAWPLYTPLTSHHIMEPARST